MTKTCRQKKRYASEEDAEIAMTGWQEAVARKGKGRAPSRVYRCPYCSGWHLTSQSKHTPLVVDGIEVDTYWGHPRDAEPVMVEGRLRMHPLAANELLTRNPHELLDLASAEIARRAAWMMKKSLLRIEGHTVRKRRAR